MPRRAEKGLHLESRALPLAEAPLVPNDEPKVFHRARFEKDLARTRAAIAPFKGLDYSGGTARQLCLALLAEAGIPEDRCPALEVSLSGRDYKSLSDKDLARIAIFFNANTDTIRQGLIVPRWAGQPPQWMFMLVADTRYLRLKDKVIMSLRCPVLTGIMAGQDLMLDFSTGYVRYILKEIGISRYEDISEKEISGMYMLVRAGVTGSNRMGALAVKATSGMKKANRELHRARTDNHCRERICACCDCLQGRDECPLACRTVTTIKETTDDRREEAG